MPARKFLFLLHDRGLSIVAHVLRHVTFLGITIDALGAEDIRRGFLSFAFAVCVVLKEQVLHVSTV